MSIGSYGQRKREFIREYCGYGKTSADTLLTGIPRFI